MNTEHSKLVSPKRRNVRGYIAPPFTLFLDINYGSKHCMSLSLSISPNNRDPCPILHPVTSEQISEISRPDFPTIPTPRLDSLLFQHAGGASHGVAPDTELAKLQQFLDL